MNMLLRFKNFIDELNQREFYKYFAIFLGIVTLTFGALFYYHGRSVSALKRQLKQVNRQREQARELLEKNAIVKQQKVEVDEILGADKTFKIKEFFTRTITELGLVPKNTKEAEISEPQDLDNGYSEIRLATSFTTISTQDLAELLYNLEKNRRIYTKELVITKALTSPAIDVMLVIATLQPKEETS